MAVVEGAKVRLYYKLEGEVCVGARGLVAAATTYGGAHGAGVGDGDGSSVGNGVGAIVS